MALRRGPTQTSILVRNLPRDIRREELAELFEKFGRVTDIYLPRDYATKLPRGIGFVQYEDVRDAADALDMNGTLVGGREIAVSYAEHGRKRPEQMSGGGAGRGYGGPPGWGGPPAWGGPGAGRGWGGPPAMGYGRPYDAYGGHPYEDRRRSRSPRR